MSKGDLTKHGGSGRSAIAATDLEARLAQVRAAVAHAPEERLVSFVCAATGRPFRARFARPEGAGKFKVCAVEKIAAEAPALRLGERLFGRSQPKPEAQQFDLHEFDLAGWHCAWCDATGTFVRCGKCGGLACRGRTRRTADGEGHFTCHEGCGSSGILGERLSSVSGDTRQQGRDDGQGHAALPAPRTALPKPR